MKKFQLYFHTLRHLRGRQVYSRIKRRILRPISPRNAPHRLSLNKVQLVPSIPKEETLLDVRTFLIHHQHVPITTAQAWSRGDQGTLILYNINYFDCLCAKGHHAKTGVHQNLIRKWITENPPGTRISWDPYPTSLRIVNWLKWHFQGNQLGEAAWESVIQQTRHLRRNLEYDLFGNHLLANAKALIFAGIAFSGEEARDWRRQGLEILATELEEQILADGGHYERSTMYHCVVLEDILDIANLLQSNRVNNEIQRAFLEGLREKITRMLNWLSAMTHPDGKISFFNDAAWRIAPTYAELAAYAERLRVEIRSTLSEGITHLVQSGYVRMQTGKAILIADVGEVGPKHLPGHAHADTLSFELSLGDSRCIVNSGTSTYDDLPLREAQRSTALHSTVTIDNENSTEVWGKFRVARRAHPKEMECSVNENHHLTLRCSHDGYQRLPGKPLHFRTWNLKPSGLEVIDEIKGNFSTATARFYLSPQYRECDTPGGQQNECLTITGPYGRVTLKNKGGILKVGASRFYSEFGKSEGNECASAVWHGSCLSTKMNWQQK